MPKRHTTGEKSSCWIGNPTMVWKARTGFHTHVLMAGMVHPEHDKLSHREIKHMALGEARSYAKKHHIKCFVLHCKGETIIDSGD